MKGNRRNKKFSSLLALLLSAAMVCQTSLPVLAEAGVSADAFSDGSETGSVAETPDAELVTDGETEVQTDGTEMSGTEAQTDGSETEGTETQTDGHDGRPDDHGDRSADDGCDGRPDDHGDRSADDHNDRSLDDHDDRSTDDGHDGSLDDHNNESVRRGSSARERCSEGQQEYPADLEEIQRR